MRKYTQHRNNCRRATLLFFNQYHIKHVKRRLSEYVLEASHKTLHQRQTQPISVCVPHYFASGR